MCCGELMAVARSQGLLIPQPRVPAGRGDQVLHDLRGDGVRTRSRGLGGGVLRFNLFLLLVFKCINVWRGENTGVYRYPRKKGTKASKKEFCGFFSNCNIRYIEDLSIGILKNP